MSRTFARTVAVATSLLLVAAACSDDDGGDGDGSAGGSGSGTAPPAEEIDYEAIGLWDDGACDESLEPLHIGLMTVFESPVLSLEDQALSL
jgi:hypothetical protein